MPSVAVVLETERLLLRRLHEDDLDTLARWNADPRFMRYMGRPPVSRAETARALRRYADHWREHGFGSLGAEERASGRLIGRTGVSYHRNWPADPEVGWGFDPDFWGRGLATEAGAACVRWACEDLRLPRLVSITVEENAASRRVMQKLGFALHARVCDPVLRLELLVHARDLRPPA